MKKRLLLFSLGLLTLVMTAGAETRVFLASDYGVTPEETEKNASNLDRALKVIKALVSPGDEVVLRFGAGRYAFHASDAKARTVYVSNHDQETSKKVGIYLKGWDHLTLDGEGAEFVFYGRMIPIVLDASTNCTFTHFSVDFDQPQIAQIEVVSSVSGSGTTFKVEPWVNYRLAANGSFEVYGEGWSSKPITGIAFENATRHIVYRSGDLSVNTAGTVVVNEAERTLRAPSWTDSRLVAGTKVALRTYYRPAPGILLSESGATALRDVRVHYAEGMGLVAQRCTDVTLDSFSVCLKGESDPRYFTTQADATHFSQCRGRIVCTNGLFEGMMDDAINVHGIYLKVKKRVSNNTLRLSFEHNQAYGFNWGDVGDSIRFLRSSTMEPVGNVNYIASIRPYGSSTVSGCREFTVTFRDDVDEEISENAGYGAENLSWCPEVEFRGNTVRNNRARGALFSSPLRTVCEDNLFDHTSGAAILLCGDCNGWYESGAVRDLLIRNNRFVNALTTNYQFTNAVISICPVVPSLSAQKEYFHGGDTASIVIEGNTFETFDNPLLYAKSTKGLVFRNNTVTKNNDYKAYHSNTEALTLERCALVEAPGYLRELVLPVFSTVASPVWYALEFKKGGNFVTDKGVGAVLKTAERDVITEQIWQFVGSAEQFVLRNAAERYVAWNGSRFIATQDSAAAVTLKLKVDSTTGAVEIQRQAVSGKGMNQFGGAGNDIPLGEWNEGDPGNAIYIDALTSEGGPLSLSNPFFRRERLYSVSGRTITALGDGVRALRVYDLSGRLLVGGQGRSVSLRPDSGSVVLLEILGEKGSRRAYKVAL